jgi:hypothetical protein
MDSLGLIFTSISSRSVNNRSYYTTRICHIRYMASLANEYSSRLKTNCAEQDADLMPLVSILRPNGRICDRLAILDMKNVFKRDSLAIISPLGRVALEILFSFDVRRRHCESGESVNTIFNQIWRIGVNYSTTFRLLFVIFQRNHLGRSRPVQRRKHL